MESHLVIDVKEDETVIALLEDNRLVELQREERNPECALGDIYLGRVRKVRSEINAALVNIGFKQPAFLSYNAMGGSFEASRKLLKKLRSEKGRKGVRQVDESAKEGNTNPSSDKDKIDSLLDKNDEVLVQVTKEPINTKGATVSTDISFTGRYIVLKPYGNGIHISQKIKDICRKEKDDYESIKIENLIASIKPDGFEVIVRTSALGRDSRELVNELKNLVNRWEEVKRTLKATKEPGRVHKEVSRAIGFIRDSFNESYTKITVNDEELYHEIREYISFLDIDKPNIVEFYNRPKPLFDAYGITKQIKSYMGRNVTYKSGAYLVIDTTEAMHVIDVNSGTGSRKSPDQKENAFNVNMLAAEEIARQLRLRDMGGIIAIDFIDMEQPQCDELYKHMVELMKNDRASHTVLPLNKFCVMQITRQRVRPATKVKTEEMCPTCHGTGKAKPSILLTDEIEEYIRRVVESDRSLKTITLVVHPYVSAYIKRGLWGKSILNSWKRTFKVAIKVEENQSFPLLNYEIEEAEPLQE